MEDLRRMRQEVGLTQVGLARASGVDRATINKIEQGKRSPSIETLEKLARAMGAEIGDFFPKAQPPLPLDEQRGLAEELLDLLDIEVLAGVERRLRKAQDPGELLELVRRALARVGVREGWTETEWSSRRRERDASEAADRERSKGSETA